MGFISFVQMYVCNWQEAWQGLQILAQSNMMSRFSYTCMAHTWNSPFNTEARVWVRYLLHTEDFVSVSDFSTVSLYTLSFSKNKINKNDQNYMNLFDIILAAVDSKPLR